MWILFLIIVFLSLPYRWCDLCVLFSVFTRPTPPGVLYCTVYSTCTGWPLLSPRWPQTDWAGGHFYSSHLMGLPPTSGENGCTGPTQRGLGPLRGRLPGENGCTGPTPRGLGPLRGRLWNPPYTHRHWASNIEAQGKPHGLMANSSPILGISWGYPPPSHFPISAF